MASKAKHKATKEKGLKLLTSKQMPQRLPIALAQVKAGNNSETSLKNKNCLFSVSVKRKY